MKAAVRIVGVLLLALGITFLVWGLEERGTFANRFLKEMANDYSSSTKQYIFGGVAMIVVGAGILVASFARRKK